MRKTTASASASASETDEVDQLLQAAHDDVLLKLSLNSHIARGASDSFDSDLSRRFQALKSRPSAPKPSPPPPQTQKIAPPPQVDDELKAVLGDDLSARFAALRGSLNPSSSSPSASGTSSSITVLPGGDIRDQDGRYDDEEDEVEKIIRWAKDAARLDPSPPSDEEAGDNDDDEEEEEEDTDGENNSDDDESTVDKKKANRTMSRPSQSQRRPKWFPRSRNR